MKLLASLMALAIAVPAAAQVLPAPGPNKDMRPFNIDTDGDGEVSYQEYLALPIAAFEQLDTDNSGKLSKEELGDRNFVIMAPEAAPN